MNVNLFDVILAVTETNNNNFGIGWREFGKLPWHIPEELKLFKRKTTNSVLIAGRKTISTLPPLPGRTIFGLTRRNPITEDIYWFDNIDSAVLEARKMYSNKKIFIAGGAEIYNLVLSNYKESIGTLHLSVMKNIYDCDVYVNTSLSKLMNDGWVIQIKEDYKEFVHYELVYRQPQELQYLQLIKEVYNSGEERITRNARTRSLFGKHLSFNLQCGFPLLTTKRMFWRGIVEELLFFLRGDTDTTLLEEKKINIWKGNTNREFLDSLGMTERNEGIMGPMYGWLWRFFRGNYNEMDGKGSGGIDQLHNVINLINTNPTSRRIIMTDYDPSIADQGVLYPCHSLIIQFYVSKGIYLDMTCYNRSSDLFLGLPFNIASSALFLTIIAKITGLIPRNFHLNLGDSHIYENHYSAVLSQIERFPYKLPSLIIHKQLNTITDAETLNYTDFELIRYQCYPRISAEMVA